MDALTRRDSRPAPAPAPVPAPEAGPTPAPAHEAPGRTGDACFHGGAFFEAVGDQFDDLDRRRGVINADVLDAWFRPAPSVLAALREHLPWLLQTSPPTQCQGLVRAIAQARDVPARCVVPGAGSSDLIFLALQSWLNPDSRVLMLDPTYGEYAHVCERIIGCRVERLPLHRRAGYRVDLDRLEQRMRAGHDLVVLVNPNNPTGRHIPRDDLEVVLSRLPARTRCWVDETYVDYAGPDQSLERFAAASRNVVVCKSLSKVFALSGMRVAYLVGPQAVITPLRALTPPWAVSLPAQVAAVHALRSPEYYAECHRETHALRDALAGELRALGAPEDVLTGVGNWVLWSPSASGAASGAASEAPSAAKIARRCRARGLYVRECAGLDEDSGGDVVRIAVKHHETQRRMLPILAWARAGAAGGAATPRGADTLGGAAS